MRPRATRTAEPPPAGAVALPVAGTCLVCSRVTRLIAEWRGPGAGVCWTCWTRNWKVYP